MYRVYGFDKGWQSLKVTDKELVVLKTIGEFIKTHDYVDCMVIKRENEMDFLYKSIKSEQDYVDYYNFCTSNEKMLTKSNKL